MRGRKTRLISNTSGYTEELKRKLYYLGVGEKSIVPRVAMKSVHIRRTNSEEGDFLDGNC